MLIHHADSAVLHNDIGAAFCSSDVSTAIDVAHQDIIITVDSDRRVAEHGAFVAAAKSSAIVESQRIAAILHLASAINLGVAIDVQYGIARNNT